MPREIHQLFLAMLVMLTGACEMKTSEESDPAQKKFKSKTSEESKGTEDPKGKTPVDSSYKGKLTDLKGFIVGSMEKRTKLSTKAGLRLGDNSEEKTGGNLLYGIDKDDQVVPLALTIGGNKINVDQLYLSKKFLMINLGEGIEDKGRYCSIYALSLESGDFLCIPDLNLDVPDASAGIDMGAQPIQANDAGDIFHMLAFSRLEGESPGTNALFRIDLSSGKVVRELVYGKSQYVNDFIVNPDGDVFYGSSDLRLRTAEGVEEVVSAESRSRVLARGRGENKNDFLSIEDNKIEMWQKGPGGFTKLAGDYFSDPTYSFKLHSAGFRKETPAANYLTLLSRTGQERTNFFVEYGKIGALPQKFTSPDNRTYSFYQIDVRGDLVALVGEDEFGYAALMQFDLSTQQWRTLIDYGAYVYSDIAITENGTLSFIGTRLIDGAEVAGEASATSVKLYQESFTHVKQLVRLR